MRAVAASLREAALGTYAAPPVDRMLRLVTGPPLPLSPAGHVSGMARMGGARPHIGPWARRVRFAHPGCYCGHNHGSDRHTPDAPTSDPMKADARRRRTSGMSTASTSGSRQAKQPSPPATETEPTSSGDTEPPIGACMTIPGTFGHSNVSAFFHQLTSSPGVTGNALTCRVERTPKLPR